MTAVKTRGAIRTSAPRASGITSLPGSDLIQDGAEHAAHHFRLRWAVLPLGNGEDGKKPSVSFEAAPRHSIALVQKRMAEMETDMYALRLDGVVVIDADTDNEATRDYITERFGNSPYQTATARGVHHFWRATPGSLPAQIREPGISIDIKSGPNAYVVGPGSIRSDGVHYRALGDPLPHPDMLPVLVDRKVKMRRAEALDASNGGQRVPVGHRNDFLHKRAVAYAKTADSLEDLRAELAAARAYFCEDPESVSDAEIHGIAKWAWDLRLRNSLYGGRQSVYHVSRMANDALLPVAGGVQAFAVFCFLSDTWGHQPDKPFAVVPKAIAASGRLKMGKNQIHDAIHLLMQTGFLIRVRQSKGKGSPALYLLGRGERVSHYIVPFSGDANGGAE